MLTEDIKLRTNSKRAQEDILLDYTKEMYNESLSIIQDIIENIAGSKLPIDFSFKYI